MEHDDKVIRCHVKACDKIIKAGEERLVWPGGHGRFTCPDCYRDIESLYPRKVEYVFEWTPNPGVVCYREVGEGEGHFEVWYKE